MLNLDQFRAVGIASVAEVETLDSYVPNLDHYRQNAYTYVPIPSAGKYYHMNEDELRDIDEDQYFHPDITMMTAFERLQEYPFLLYDEFMRFRPATEDAGRRFIPDGWREFDLGDEKHSARGVVENADELLPKLRDHGIKESVLETLFNLDGSRYSIITLADANKRRGRELFYHAISEFEIQLANLIKTHFPDSLIADVGEDEIERWYRAKLDELEIHIAEHMYLSTLLKVGGKEEEIRERFGYTSRKKFKDNLGGLNDLRHKVMHPTRALVHNRDDLAHEVDRVHRIKDALDHLNGEQIQPEYPRG